MLSDEIRSVFLDFFQKKQHKILPSFPLIPRRDPSLLLINAGMAPLKRYFLGQDTPSQKTLATCQKCVRVVDIEKVGKTIKHLTFFEMLGNFSFGDYFKEGAILFAWEFLTEVLKLPREKLYISVYLDDEEAYNVWKDKVGIPKDKIYHFGEEYNFWSAGETGPCGPCSEIFIDLGEETGCGENNCKINCDCDRFIEVWNLVFMQYNRKEDRTLVELPQKNIDTGMGLERLCTILQNKKSPYETNLFYPIMEQIGNLTENKNKEALRIIADHLRSAVFLIGDGILPSNEGRGYVLRRILRRGIRISKMQEPFLYKIVSTVVDLMKDTYSELLEHQNLISRTIFSEEEKFLQTVKIGEEKLYQIINSSKEKIIKGEDVFKLYDTYGYPKELTEEIAKENGLKIDEDGFKKLLEEQRGKARRSHNEKISDDKLELYKNLASEYTTSFVSYEHCLVESKIIAIIKDNEMVNSIIKDDECEIILDKTPFYAESGGQVGDTGKVQSSKFKNQSEIEIYDTQKIAEGLIVHGGKVIEGNFKVGDIILAEINTARRKAIEKHHTSTHLLQASLREILGKEVHQSGSLVDEDRARFDFTYFGVPTEEEIEKVEDVLNKKILENIPVNIYFTDITSAKEKGIISLFDEKYKEEVRVIEIDDFSRELCGGCHCRTTGEIGQSKIISEEGIGSGLRRITLVSGLAAFHLFSEQFKITKNISNILKVKTDKVISKINEMQESILRLDNEIFSLKQKILRSETDEILKGAIQKNGTKIVIHQFDNLNYDELRQLGDIIKNKVSSYIILLVSIKDGKINFVAMASVDLVKKGIDVSKILKEVAKITSGSAGGKKDLAQGGGKDISKLPEALNFAEKMLVEKL